MGDETQQPELETVQHPTLGPLQFPKDMGPDERNEVIQRHLAERGSQPAQEPEPGFLDKEIPNDSYKTATLSGIQSIGRGVRSGYQGLKAAFAPPEDDTEKNIGAINPIALPAYRMAKPFVNAAKMVPELPSALHDINQSPDPLGVYAKVAQDTAGEGAGQALTALATEGTARAVPMIGRTGAGIRDFAQGNADAAATRGMNIPPKSPKMQAALRDVNGARPYLKGADSLADAQAKIPNAKAEIWEPYNKAVDMMKGKTVEGPDGPTTVGDLEAERLKVSAEQQAASKVKPTDQQTAVQQDKHVAQLKERYKAITDALDPHLRETGIDPNAIREAHGHVKGVERTVSGRSTVSEQPKPTGLGRMKNVSPLKPSTWVGEPIAGVNDIVAGRHPMGGIGRMGETPTDLNIREGFRKAGPKPNFGEPVEPGSVGRGPLLKQRLNNLGGAQAIPPIQPKSAPTPMGMSVPERAQTLRNFEPKPPATEGEVMSKQSMYRLGAGFTGEGFKQEFGLPHETSFGELERQGLIRQNEEGLWEVNGRDALRVLESKSLNKGTPGSGPAKLK